MLANAAHSTVGCGDSITTAEQDLIVTEDANISFYNQ